MAIPSTQSIRLSDISVELGLPRTTKMALGHPDVRTFLGIPSGKVGLGQVRGASFGRAIVSHVISAHSQNLTINLNTLPGYQAGKSDITITVNPGIYVWSATGNPALIIVGGTNGDTLKLVNNGFIMGLGGNAGYYDGTNGINPTPGQPAMAINYPITLDNQNGYIGGGGGGGALGAYGAGGGAGGGQGGYWVGYTTPGAGGAIGQVGGNGSVNASQALGSGGGGGRIMPGVGGNGVTLTSSVTYVAGLGGGAGGGGGASEWCYTIGDPGGGGWGAKGGDRTNYYSTPLPAGATVKSGPGGSAGAAGGTDTYTGNAGPVSDPSFIGAAGGKAIVTNGRTVTYVGTSASRVFGIVG